MKTQKKISSFLWKILWAHVWPEVENSILFFLESHYEFSFKILLVIASAAFMNYCPPHGAPENILI